MKKAFPIASILVLVALTGSALLLAQAPRTADVQFKAAQHKEEVEGDLKGAIEQYQKIAQSGDRVLAAKALIRMAECYQKLGDAESQKIYERVVREFADQVESAVTARTRLASLMRPATTTSPSGVVVRQVWTGSEVDLLGVPSLDGRYLSFVDWETGQLALRHLSTGEKRRLTNGPSGEFAFYSRISPDGQKVAYVWVDKENPYHLRVTSINDVRNGIKPRVLYRDTPFYMDFGDWSPDGKYVLANIRGIDLISASDGTITVLKTLNWGVRPKPRFSPDGRWIVYNLQQKQDSPDSDIFVLATDGSCETPLVEHVGDDKVLGWAPDGKQILFASDRSGTIDAWIIGVADGKPQGESHLVKRDIGNILPMGFTRAGAFYYGLSTGVSDVYLATLDPQTGRVINAPKPVSERFQGRGSSAAWSPDGQLVAYLSNRRGPLNSARGPRVISIRSIETGEERELSTDLSFEICCPPTRLQWSPDGRLLLATGSDNKGRGGLYRIDVQTGEVAPIVQGSSLSFRPQGVWSKDGKAIFYSSTDLAARDGGIWRRDLESNRETEIYRKPAGESDGSGRNLALSPDGQWLAFGNHRVLVVIPSSGGEPRELFRLQEPEGRSLSGLEWAGDGEHLLFSIGRTPLGSSNVTPGLWRIPAAGGEPQKIGLATQDRTTLAIHPDGRQIAFTAGEPKQEVWVMENFLPPLETPAQ